MDLIFAIMESTHRGIYLANESLIEEYIAAGYTVYIQHEDGTMELIGPVPEEDEDDILEPEEVVEDDNA